MKYVPAWNFYWQFDSDYIIAIIIWWCLNVTMCVVFSFMCFELLSLLSVRVSPLDVATSLGISNAKRHFIDFFKTDLSSSFLIRFTLTCYESLFWREKLVQNEDIEGDRGQHVKSVALFDLTWSSAWLAPFGFDLAYINWRLISIFF